MSALLVTFAREGIESFRAHPDFDAALLRNTAAKANQFASSSSIHRFALDRGHSLLGMFAVCLHFDGRLTVGTLQAAAQETAAASRGRVRSFLAVAKKIGAITEMAAGADRRVRHLAVTEPFLDFMRERLRIDLDSLAVLSPLGRDGLKALADPGFFPAYMRIAGEGIGRGGFVPTENGVMELFAYRHMGLQVLYDILSGDAASLLSKPVAVSVSALSKRFGVSRAHILKLLRDADKIGFLSWRTKARSVEFSPRLVDEIRTYIALILINTAYVVLRMRERRTIDDAVHPTTVPERSD